MKKILEIAGFLFLCAAASAQMTTVTGTVTDTDGTLWANGTVKVQFVPNPSQPNISVYNINGTPLSQAVIQQGPISLGSGGTFSLSVYNNTVITPVGSQWQFTVCPNATSKCGSYTFVASGSSMDISSALTTAIPPPRFPGIAGNYGYADLEVQQQLPVGATYWNVTSACQRYDSGGGIWVCGSLPSGCTVTFLVNCGGTGTASFTPNQLLLSGSTSTGPLTNSGVTQTGSGTGQVDTFPGSVVISTGPGLNYRSGGYPTEYYCNPDSPLTFLACLNGMSASGGTFSGAIIYPNASNSSLTGSLAPICQPTTGGYQTNIGCNALTSSLTVFPASSFLCAHGGDTTLGNLTVSAMSISGTTATITVSSSPIVAQYLYNEIFNISGVTASGGTMTGLYQYVSEDTSVITATTQAGQSGTYVSGGTLNHVCINSSDATSLTDFGISLTIPAPTNYPTRYLIKVGLENWSSVVAASVQQPELLYNGSVLTANSGFTSPHVSNVGYGFPQNYAFTFLPGGGVVTGLADVFALGSTLQAASAPGVIGAITTSAAPITFQSSFALSGLGTASYSSGGTGCTTGTQNVTFSSNGGVLGTIAVSGGVPTGSITLSNTGYGFSGTTATGQVDTCTGTTTFTITLAGAQGNALRIFYVIASLQV